MNIGDRIYYTGDMANQPAWLTITSLRQPGCYDTKEGGAGGQPFLGIFDSHIGREYHGHCNPRFVTEAAYVAYRNAQLAALSKARET